MKPDTKEANPKAVDTGPKAAKAKPKQKAQAAMEYLMTYGWALIAFAVVAAALVAMTIYTDSPEMCYGFDRLHYVDHALAPDGTFSVALQNGTGASIMVDSVSFSGDINGPGSATPATVASGETFQIHGTGTADLEGDDYKTSVSVKYVRGGSITITEHCNCGGRPPVQIVPQGNATGSGYINCGDLWCLKTAITQGEEYARQHNCPVIEMADLDGDGTLSPVDVSLLKVMLRDADIDCSTI